MRVLLAWALLFGAAACDPEGAPQAVANTPARVLGGCYDVTHGGTVTVPSDGGSGFEVPPRIEFSGTAFHDSSDTRIVAPEGALPSIHGLTGARIVGDSLHMDFSTGYIGVRATLGPSGDGWVGTARNWVHSRPPHIGFEPRPIELTAVPCDSPPPVSIDVMRQLGRSVTFVDGRTITVGEPAPEWLESILDEDGDGELTGVGPLQGIFGTPERITVSVRRRYGGIVTWVRLFYSPETDTFERLEERLRETYGAPDGRQDRDPRVVRYQNRITGLALMLLQDPRHLILDLRDRRYL